MASIDVERIACRVATAGLWPELASVVRRWCASRRLPLRDAVVLLPFAALLPLARQAFAAAGGWQPRVETPQTLADTLAPPPSVPAGTISGDGVRDRLQAAAWLRQQAWGRERSAVDPATFATASAWVADAAQALVSGAERRPLAARAAYWDQARALAGGGGAIESLLLRVAIEWAAIEQPCNSDTLFAHRPSAWVVLQLGGTDAMAQALLQAAEVPGLLIDADPPPMQPFAEFLADSDAEGLAVERWVCDDLESEAVAAATRVIEHLGQGQAPIALVALDRVLVRRVRAHLLRAGVSIADETGWRLSTTPAAARVMALLRAASPHAGPDAWLDWLKSGADPGADWIDRLELHWRQLRVDAAAREEALSRWRIEQGRLLPWREGRERSLLDWLELLRRSAHEAADDAGQAVRQALHLDDRDEAWTALARQMPMSLAAFTAWVDEVLDTANLEPARDPNADVILTPLSRAIGRPFTKVVIAGADHQHLGAGGPTPALISDRMAAALGLEHSTLRLQRQNLALVQLLRCGGVTVLRRRAEAGEPFSSSPSVQGLVAEATARAGRTLWPEKAWLAPSTTVPRSPLPPPRPMAPDDLPARLSPSAIEALRDCPYRFFARSVLRLAAPEELQQAANKRDYGTWLHALLYEFHGNRGEDAEGDRQALQRAADAATAALGLDPAELLPFQASFEALAPAYLQWLQARESRGLRFQAGEHVLRSSPVPMAPHVLEGRVDRIDADEDGRAQVIDYKTGTVADLKKRVARPLEDTQLVVYTALLRAALPHSPALRACYLALDDADAPNEIEHTDVEAAVAPFFAGLGADFAALRAGAAMPALGQGEVCERCEMRGLCRRDHRPVERVDVA